MMQCRRARCVCERAAAGGGSQVFTAGGVCVSCVACARTLEANGRQPGSSIAICCKAQQGNCVWCCVPCVYRGSKAGACRGRQRCGGGGTRLVATSAAGAGGGRCCRWPRAGPQHSAAMHRRAQQAVTGMAAARAGTGCGGGLCVVVKGCQGLLRSRPAHMLRVCVWQGARLQPRRCAAASHVCCCPAAVPVWCGCVVCHWCDVVGALLVQPNTPLWLSTRQACRAAGACDWRVVVCSMQASLARFHGRQRVPRDACTPQQHWWVRNGAAICTRRVLAPEQCRFVTCGGASASAGASRAVLPAVLHKQQA